jgi:chitin synthase
MMAGAVVNVGVILSFSSVMILPVVYYTLIVVWQPRGFRERVQYLIGLFIYVIFGMFLNIIVFAYALWNLNNFSWGRTRLVVKEPEMVMVPDPVHVM